jgi:Mg-chelatase subunit ChlD
MRAEILRGPNLSRRLTVLREIDVAAHDTLVEALPWMAEHLEGETDFVEIADLIAQVATETPESARVFAGRIGAEPALTADVIGLRKWALHGLQRHRHDAKRRIHYFEWADPLVFSDSRAKSDTDELLDRREALLHYLAGFGFDDFAIDLHEPRPVDMPSPAATIDGDVIRLPRRFEGVEPKDREFLLRAILAHAAAHLRHSPGARPAGNRRPSLLAVTALIEDARVERLMVQQYPGLWALWERFHTASKQVSGFDFAGLAARLARALHDPAYADTNSWVCKGRELFEGAAALDLHDVAAFDHLARKLSIDLGKMRLALPRHYRPAPTYRDDNAILWSPDAALPRDEERHADVEFVDYDKLDDNPAPVDLTGIDLRRRFHYPEWDYRLEALRDDWTTVFEDLSERRRKAKASHVAPTPRGPVLGLERSPDRSIRLSRLPEGDELDLNALVDNAVQQRARLAPDGRIFCRHGRRRRSTAIILLMDLSASTDRFVPGSFTKVIDLEKQAATVVAQALDAERDRIAVHGFVSNGRQEVVYERIKDFDEPFDAPQQARLAALTSRLSTRMGAALRHATSTLAKETADHKVILLLTDGEPSDIDVVEENYLIEDARDAVTSAAGQHVRTFCLTLDRRADPYVRRIFGARNYLITERASAFTNNTSKTLIRLLAP